MEPFALAVHAVLIALLAAAVWRLWVLARQVKRTGDAVAGARSGLNERHQASGVPVAAYAVEIHRRSAASPVTVVQARPDDPGGERRSGRAIPVVLSSSRAAEQLRDAVSAGAVTHLVAGSAACRVSPGGAWEPAPGERWSPPGNSSDSLLWAEPLSGGDAAAFPLPALGRGSAIALPDEAGERGFVRILVLAL